MTSINIELFSACKKGDLFAVQGLSKKGADIHANNNKAIRVASENGYLSIVQFLVEKGANIHANSDYPVRRACENGYLDVVIYLVSKGSDIHADNDYAIKEASSCGQLDVVKYLLEISPRLKDTALVYSSQSGNMDIVKYLIEGGVDIKKQKKAINGAKENGYENVVDFLQDRGTEGKELPEIIEPIREKSEEAKKYRKNMRKKFFTSCKEGDLTTVKNLLSQGVINVHVKRDRALKNASLNGHLDIVEFLVECGADIHAEDDLSFRCACMYDHLPVVKFLVGKGANIHADGDAVLEYTQENSLMIKFLKSC
jgi:ankyrin repeat protein